MSNLKLEWVGSSREAMATSHAAMEAGRLTLISPGYLYSLHPFI